MKKYFLLLSFCLFAGSCLHAQVLDKATLEVQYRLKYVKDTTKSFLKSEDVFLLLIGSKVSTFYSYNTFLVDSLIKADERLGVPIQVMVDKRASYGTRGAGYELFKNYPEEKITTVDKIISSSFYYDEPLDSPQWSISSDTMTVVGYVCQKATCDFRGRKYTAWFASGIPVSNGPWKFSGLPGLILKVNDTQLNYIFECVGIRNLETPKPIEISLDKCKRVSKSDFMKLERRSHEDPMSLIRGMDGVTISESSIPASAKVKRLPYNPIER